MNRYFKALLFAVELLCMVLLVAWLGLQLNPVFDVVTANPIKVFCLVLFVALYALGLRVYPAEDGR